MFSSGLIVQVAGEICVFFMGMILQDIPELPVFLRIGRIGNRTPVVCAGYAVQSTGEWH